ncbi:MAG: FG-GAP-like repeat-containing protein [Candidatus Polarisedimenticolia bacterium]
MFFAGGRLIVVARTEEIPSWEWSMTPVRWGRGAAGTRVAQGGSMLAEQVNANRIEIDRGTLVEWLRNDPRGLEHGFTLREPPPGGGRAGAAPPVWIELVPGGSVTPVLSTDAVAIDVVTGRGAGMIHAGLSVRDDDGRTLPSRVEAIEGRLRLVIDDRSAAYPLVASLRATSSTHEGLALAEDGSAAGLSAAGWTVLGAQGGANFGISVGTAGDVNGDGFADVVVGAYLYDNGQTNEGRAFVYHGSPTGPQATAAWTAESNEPFASFGFSVATAGDVNGDGYDDVIVGATRHENGQEDEGGAWVYLGSAAGLAASAAWSVESDLEYSRLGGSVGTAGDVNGDGYADIIVSARFFGEAQSDRGKAYVYHGSPIGPSPVANWSVVGSQNNQQFGSSVGTAGDVNADGYSDVIVGSSGTNSAFVFHGSATGLPGPAAWTAVNAQAGAWFGTAAKTAGDVNGDGYSDVIVGAYSFDNGQTDEGGAFVYHGSPAGLSPAPAWTAEADQPGAAFGIDVEGAGDVNGDGYSDVIVGAPLYDNIESAEGRAYVYLGSPTGLATGAVWTAESDQTAANIGRSVGGAGDVNNDGYDDVIIGAPVFDDTQADEGRVYLFLGHGAGIALPPGSVRTLYVATSGADLHLTWDPACPASDYAIYEGTIGDFTSHAPRLCSTGGATSSTFSPPSGSVYYLVVPLNGSAEGSYGTTSSGTERPVGSPACRPQLLGGCR